jgi:hypothetical protein
MSAPETEAIAAEIANLLGGQGVQVRSRPSKVRIEFGELKLKVSWKTGAPPTAEAIANLARDWLNAQRSFSPESESV